MTEERCPVCDREACHREAMAGAPLSGNIFPYFEAHNDCDNHRVDWRARALEAEKKIQELEGFAIIGMAEMNNVYGLGELGERKK